MKLLFKSELIVPDVKSTTAFAAIAELVEHVVSVGRMPAETAEPITLAVKQRETSMSTGIGFGIAIPHASTTLVKEMVLAVDRSGRGIDFDSLDGQLVRLVVLMIVPAHAKEQHLPALAQASRLLRRNDIRAALETAPDAETISDILNGNRLVAV